MVGELEIRTGVCLGDETLRNFAGFLPLAPPSLMETLRDILSTDAAATFGDRDGYRGPMIASPR